MVSRLKRLKSKEVFQTREFLPELHKLICGNKIYYNEFHRHTLHLFLFLVVDKVTGIYYFKSNDDLDKRYKLSEIVSWSYVYVKED